MRTWTVESSYPIIVGEEVTHTVIMVSSRTNGFATFGERVVGDHRGKSEGELVKLALEQFFKNEFAEKAMAESVQTVDKLEVVVAKLAKELEVTNQKVAAVTNDVKAVREMVLKDKGEQTGEVNEVTVNPELEHEVVIED